MVVGVHWNVRVYVSSPVSTPVILHSSGMYFIKIEDGNGSIKITLSTRRSKCHGSRLKCHIYSRLRSIT